jgi:hypothetical protein
MTTLTPQQKAANTHARNKFLKALKEKRELYRNDKRALAAQIAIQIRLDEHGNENPDDYYDNGQMHWYQEDWGRVKVSAETASNFTPIGSHLAVSCPTTGCVAGWATTLAGHPMVMKFTTVKELIESYDGEAVSVGECILDDGSVMHIVDRARELLDLTRHQSEWLFDGYNSKEQVLWALELIVETGYFDPDVCPFDQQGNRIRDDEGNWIDENDYVEDNV